MTQSPNRILAVVFGVGFLLLGILGFLYTGGVGIAATAGGRIFGIFEVNVLHNLLHLVVGVALLIAGLAGATAAKIVNTTIGALYLLLGVVGLFILGSSLNILALNGGDNVLHFAVAVVLLAVGLGADKRGPA